jgi:hypothetical protein
MRKYILMAGLLFVAVVGWRLAERLSADALGMALGVLFGILAGIPTALLVLVSARRRDSYAEDPRGAMRGRQLGYGPDYPALPQQAPVIILTGNGTPAQMGAQPMHGYQAQYALPAPAEFAPQRQFRLVGEKEEIIND